MNNQVAKNNNPRNQNQVRNAFSSLSQRAFDILRQSARVFSGLLSRLVSVGNSTNGKSVFDCIPNEIWRSHIFVHLSQRDLRTLSKVSQRFCGLTHHCIRLVNSEDMNAEEHLDEILKNIASKNQQIGIKFHFSYSTVARLRPINDNDFNINTLIKCLNKCPSLYDRICSIEFSNSHRKLFFPRSKLFSPTIYLLGKTKNLKTLQLPIIGKDPPILSESFSWYYEGPIVVDLGKADFSSLEELVFDDYIFCDIKLPRQLNSLKTLTFKLIDIFWNISLRNNVPLDLSQYNLSNLEKLIFNGNIEGGLILMPQRLDSLKTLEFNGRLINGGRVDLSNCRVTHLKSYKAPKCDFGVSFIPPLLESHNHSPAAKQDTSFSRVTHFLNSVLHNDITPVVATLVLIVSLELIVFFALYQLHQFYHVFLSKDPQA